MCTVIDYGVLPVWFLFLTLARDWIQRPHGNSFRLSPDQFDTFHYAGMSVYKVGILLIYLVPYIALRIVG